MFAVPGWSVDSASLVQEKRSSKPEGQTSPGASAPLSRKRKGTHSHNHPAPKVSGSALEKLWRQQDAGRPTGAKPSARNPVADKTRATQPPHARKHGTPTTRTREDKRDKDKGRPKEQENAKDQPPQKHQDRKSRDKTSRLSNVDSDITSFPRDTALGTHPPPPIASSKLTPLQAKMRSKLTSARFRRLNETLYTTTSAAAMDLFSTSPDLFAEYHAGFSQQVKDSWPVNPVDRYIAAIRSRGAVPRPTDPKQSDRHKTALSPLPHRPKTSLCTIADLGCGDAPLARGCQSVIQSHKLKFHNFDLHASSTQITKADMSNLPLRDGQVDIAVFCLSLMGTNWIDFVEEAWRILRGDGKGECWVSEVKSRFGRVGKRAKGEAVDNSVGKRRKNPKSNKRGDGPDDDQIGPEIFVEDASATPDDETDISAFVKVFTRRGFQLREGSVDKSNKMFVSMIFVKSGIPTAGKHKGLKWTGREYQHIDDGKMKRGAGGASSDADMAQDEEAKVLKPCVYKTR